MFTFIDFTFYTFTKMINNSRSDFTLTYKIEPFNSIDFINHKLIFNSQNLTTFVLVKSTTI